MAPPHLQEELLHLRTSEAVDARATSAANHEDGNSSAAATSMVHSPSITAVTELDEAFLAEQENHIKHQQSRQPCQNVAPPSPYAAIEGLTNVTLAPAGARVLFATDEWFATAENLLKPTPPHFDPEAYCVQGKVMDGWESRRRREAGHDWCLIQLAARCEQIFGIEIDTAHFTGNNAPAISIEGADLTCEQALLLTKALPHAVDRLLFGGIQGTGATPDEVLQASEACRTVVWKNILPKTPLGPGYEESRMHYFTLPTENSMAPCTHIRVNYYPDGGVARLYLWGRVSSEQPILTARPAYSPIKSGNTCTVVSHSSCQGNTSVLPSCQLAADVSLIELSSAAQGGKGVACSNKHYGEPSFLLQSNLGSDMGDGWETARHPNRPSILVTDPKTGLVDSPLTDWCVFQLGQPATGGIDKVILDTKHFRGNYPESVLVEACYCPDQPVVTLDNQLVPTVEWFTLVPRGRMAPDSEHLYEASKLQLSNTDRPVSHVKVSIFPDGGVSRVRVFAKKN